jgi:citrate synthase
MSSQQEARMEGLEASLGAGTSIARIDGEQGQFSVYGYRIEDLAELASFEEVAFLVWNERLPSALELANFQKEMAEERQVPAPVFDLLWALPRDTHPVVVARTAVSLLGAFDPDAESDDIEDGIRKARRLTAQLATVVAAWERIRRGLDPVEPDRRLDHAANLMAMVSGESPDPEMARLFERVLVLYAEHGLNVSTFAARITAATRSDLHSAVTAALCPLKGRLHGGASQAVMEMLLRIGNVAGVRPHLEAIVARGAHPMGFGHRVFRTVDPRTPILARVADVVAGLTGDRLFFDMAVEGEKVMAALRPGLVVNMDWYCAPALYGLGFAQDLFSAVLAGARVVGFCGHALEQDDDNRPIRLRAPYIGPKPQPFVPLDDR